MVDYPPPPEPGMTRTEWERQLLNPWRQQLKRKLFMRRGPMCERGCGRRAVDLDEPIIPRADMRGLDLDRRRLAFGSVNAELACAQCNRESAHNREAAWGRAVARFGLEAMREWYNGIGLKAPDRRFSGD